MENRTEKVLQTVPANRYHHFMNADGGKLLVTNYRLVFQPHSVNFDTSDSAIDYEDIVEVGLFNPLGIIPNGLYVKTVFHRTHKFIVWKREAIAELIREHLPKSKNKPKREA